MRRILFVGLLVLMAALTACSSAQAPATQAPATQAPATQAPATQAPATQAPATQAPAAAEAAVTGKITVAGSTTVQPLAEKLAEAFSAINKGVDITIQGGGSSVGVKSGGEGTVNIGTASRDITDDEKKQYPDMRVFIIARDGIAVIANPGVSVSNLTKKQVADIFSGKITNWKDVGGADKPIVVVSREEGSGTRNAFEELVMGKNNPIVATAILQSSNGAVRTTVSTTPDAVGYLSFGYLDQSVKALSIEGVEATEANAASGKYPVVRPLIMLTKGDPAGATKAWLDWILSPAGQKIVAKEGYIAVK
jgi:phosphate transport system substrate-binding protein